MQNRRTFLSKFIKKQDSLRPIFDKIDLSRSEFKFKFEFGPRIRIEIVATIDRTAGIDSKLSINQSKMVEFYQKLVKFKPKTS